MTRDYHSEAAKPHRILVVHGEPQRLSPLGEVILVIGMVGISAGLAQLFLLAWRAL